MAGTTKPGTTKPKNKTYNFVVVEKGKVYSDEVFSGPGKTPEEAAVNATDEYDLDYGSEQTYFYFTLDGDDTRQTGFLKVTRTGLKVERVDEK